MGKSKIRGFLMSRRGAFLHFRLFDLLNLTGFADLNLTCVVLIRKTYSLWGKSINFTYDWTGWYRVGSRSVHL